MVVKIRLARWGVKRHPFYGIVIANARAPRDGKHLERVGTFNPLPDPHGNKHIELNIERIKYWLGVGAQPSDRVAWILAKAGLMPLSPQLQHKMGIFDINNRKTWDVEVRDEKGIVISTLENSVAQKSQNPDIARIFQEKPEPEKPRIRHDTIVLDGTPPKAPLTEWEILKTLKTVTGIKGGW